MEAVVKRFEENGYTPTQAFIAFDEDDDEVLTLEEIKEGVKCLKIDLLDTEKKLLFENIDKNSDGVLTLEEWVGVLQPQLNAQREYIQIMKDLDIHDPLVLEEQILDVLFKKRRLAAEVKVMRAARGKEMYARKKQVEGEQKVLADKILELERQVKDSRWRQEEDRANEADEKMRSGLQTRADLEAEYELLMKTKKEIEIEYAYRQEYHQKELFTADQLHTEINRYAVQVKQDRDRQKL